MGEPLRRRDCQRPPRTTRAEISSDPGLSGERSGVSPEVIEAADAVVAIPMLGMANSLNVATAAAILIYRLTVRFDNI